MATMTEQSTKKPPTKFAQGYFLQMYSLWDVIVPWRDSIFYAEAPKTTRYNYLTSIRRLVDEKIVDPSLPLHLLNKEWCTNAKKSIDAIPDWSKSTKNLRKSCLNTFFHFASEYSKPGSPLFNEEPYRRTPGIAEIDYLLSAWGERTRMLDFDLEALFYAVFENSKRDAFIILTMLHTGRTLDEILNIQTIDLMKGNACTYFIRFPDAEEFIPPFLGELLLNVCASKSLHLFTTSKGKRLRRYQVIRRLKDASKAIGLDFEVTPKILQGKALSVICHDKLSLIEKMLQETKT